MVYLIYDEADFQLNQSFANRIVEELSLYGEEGKVLMTEKLGFRTGTEPGILYEGNVIALPSFVIARARDFRISESLERMQIPVANSSVVCKICNDKWATCQVCASLGLPIMETGLGRSALQQFSFPYVIKSVDGHGGKEVFLVHNEEEIQKALQTMEEKRFIVQKPASDIGIDVRVYVCAGKIIQAMKRVSKTDFRSNFSLGGTAEPYELNETEQSYVRTLMEHFQFDYAGIDFIYHEGKPVLNEIEDVVGARMLYSYTDYDIVKIYIEYLMRKYGKNQ